MKKVLEGIRILEWASWLNAPSGGYMLGDLGAEVIKIEDPVRGDPLRGLASQYGGRGELPGDRVLGFETANRSKRGITLNVTEPKGREILYRLVEKSDVFITAYGNKLAKRFQVDYETLRKYNPKLIYAHGTGWGLFGPASERRSFDPLIQGASGLMYAVGDRNAPEPSSIVGAVVDIAGGTMLAYGILAALVARERHGIGQEISSGLLGAAIHLQAMNVNKTAWTGRSIRRSSRRDAANPLATYYRCADGKFIMLCAVQFQRFWPEFCKVMGVDAALAPGGKPAEKLVEYFDKVFSTKSRDEWFRMFEEKGASFPYGPVHMLEDAINDPQVVENQYVVPFDHPTMGHTRTIGFPVWFSETPCEIYGPAPEFGQHTEEVLIELAGLTWEELEKLRHQGII